MEFIHSIKGFKYFLSVQSHFRPTAHIKAFCHGSYESGDCIETAFCKSLHRVQSLKDINDSSHEPRP